MTIRIRHPRVAGAYEAVNEAQAATLRMSGWVTEDENPDLFAADREAAARAAAEAEGDEETQDEPEDSGQQKNAPRRTRPRATSEKENG